MNYLDVVVAFTLGVSITYLGEYDGLRSWTVLALSLLSMLYLIARLP